MSRALTRDYALNHGRVASVILEDDVVAHVRAVPARLIIGWAKADERTASAELVAASVCDEQGSPLFDQRHLAEAVEEVMNWPGHLFSQLLEAALEINALSKSEAAAVGNSAGGPT